MIKVGDGTIGWRRRAVRRDPGCGRVAGHAEAAAEQLAFGGRLVIPLGDKDRQVLNLVTRRDADQYDTTTLGDVRFVPLIGEHGFRT